MPRLLTQLRDEPELVQKYADAFGREEHLRKALALNMCILLERV